MNMPPKQKWTSAGGVVLEKLEQPWRVYIIKPSNNYGPWCFPKGQIDEGESQEAAAVREVAEESGIPAKILPNGYLGVGTSPYSISHFYLMVQTGPAGQHDFETEAVDLVTLDEAEAIFSSGNPRDVGILSKARAYLENMEKESTVTESKKPLNELHMNLLGKIFFTTLGAWLVGKATNTKIRGNQDEIQAITNALMSSRRFQDELRRPGASVESVIDKLGLKHMSANEFERVLGVSWPL